MESFPKNRKLLENRCGGKFTELGNFGIFLLGSVAKRQLVPKHGKILLFFFPFLGICWTVLGKKMSQKSKSNTNNLLSPKSGKFKNDLFLSFAISYKKK